MNDKFFKKSGMVISRLSRDLLVAVPGERLPSLDDYAARLDVSRGVVQQALAYLCATGAIVIEKSHGTGTRLESCDSEILRENTGWDIVTINMPVPGTDYLSSLTTGLYQHNGVFPMPLAMIYVTGSDNRLYYLKKKMYDAIVVSLASAKRYCREHSFIDRPLVLDGCEYAGQFCAYFANGSQRKIGDGTRVAYDPSSSDHFMVTRAMCSGHEVVWVKTPFVMLADTLKAGKVDVVFHRREYPMLQFEYLNPLPVSVDEMDESDSITPAILFNRENYGIRALFEHYLSIEKVCRIQAQVRAGKMEPRFF